MLIHNNIQAYMQVLIYPHIHQNCICLLKKKIANLGGEHVFNIFFCMLIMILF